MKELVCTWHENDKVLAIVEKENGQYYLDGQPVDYELGRRLLNYNYCNMRKEVGKYEQERNRIID